MVRRAGGGDGTKFTSIRLWAVAAIACGCSIGAAAAAPLAHGVIVEFKHAPSHESLVRRQAMAVPDSPGEAEARRVRAVLRQVGLESAVLRPVGRSAHLVHAGRVLDGAQAQALADRLSALPEVEWAVPNHREQRLQTVPNDPMFPSSALSSGQWWLHPVRGTDSNAKADRLRGVPGIQSAWAPHPGSRAAIVAVLDTGITAHPDLDANVLPGYDFVSEVEYANDGNGRDADPADPGDFVSQADKTRNPALFGSCDVANSSWHGTDIAGILAAVTNNAAGVAAINWNARVLPVRVAGKCGADVADIVDGMRWAAGLHVVGVPDNPTPARIVNISFGSSMACNPAYQGAIDELAARGALLVAAAGNGHAGVNRPASCNGVVGVAALNRDGFKATYSSFGPEVIVSTVGGDSAREGAWGALLGDDGLLGLDNSGLQAPAAPTYSRLFGTSFAAPIVSGTIGLMLSMNPGLSAAQIVDGLKRTARPHATSSKIGLCTSQNPGRCLCTTATCGAGILDAEQALSYARDPAAYVAPVRQAAVIDNADVTAAVALGNDLPPNPAVPSTSGGGGGGGGGALGAQWLAGLAVALAVLRQAKRA
jgi:serine protease